MKIIYSDILEEILKARESAIKEGRTIKEIVLTKSEWDALCNTAAFKQSFGGVCGCYAGTIYGIRVVWKDDK